MNSDLAVSLKSNHLKGRKIALCITGSIAACETVKLAREFRRHAAEVQVYMTPSAEKFITPLSLKWASTNDVVTELSGAAEHIARCDLVLVAPATLHTINKIAQGFADNVVTTLIASAWGERLPIVFLPTMHKSLGKNPVYQKSLETLSAQENMTLLEPIDEEGKLKFLESADIVARCAHLLNQEGNLAGKKILITAGPTEGPIDKVRFLTNTSTGSLGVGLAKALYMEGAAPTLVYGPGKITPHSYYDVKPVRTPDEMLEAVVSEVTTHDYAAAIFTAAVLDHVPVAPYDKKLSSQKPLHIEYRQTPKIIREIDKYDKQGKLYKVGFKLEWDKTKDERTTLGYEVLEKMGAQVVVMNDLAKISDDKHPALIMDRKKQNSKR